MSPISAFVITCDKKPVEVLRAVLKRVSWADETILLDKGRTGFTGFIEPYGYKYKHIPWSPVHEADRNIALEMCTHPWIVAVDDDEILSPECAEIFRRVVESNEIDVLEIPIRHHILGRFDRMAPYWPEWRPVLHRRGSLVYGSTLHHGIGIVEGARVLKLDAEAESFIDHLSHANVSQWLEKTNRYTDYPIRTSSGRIETNYVGAVSWLRETYDRVDALKRWEQANLPDGEAEFRRIAEEVLRG